MTANLLTVLGLAGGLAATRRIFFAFETTGSFIHPSRTRPAATPVGHAERGLAPARHSSGQCHPDWLRTHAGRPGDIRLYRGPTRCSDRWLWIGVPVSSRRIRIAGVLNCHVENWGMCSEWRSTSYRSPMHLRAPRRRVGCAPVCRRVASRPPPTRSDAPSAAHHGYSVGGLHP